MCQKLVNLQQNTNDILILWSQQSSLAFIESYRLRIKREMRQNEDKIWTKIEIFFFKLMVTTSIGSNRECTLTFFGKGLQLKFNCYSKNYLANCESYDNRKSGENSNFPGTHSICTFFSLSWKKFLSHNCWFVRQLKFVKRGMWTNSKKIGKSNWFSRTVTLKNYVLLTMVAK